MLMWDEDAQHFSKPGRMDTVKLMTKGCYKCTLGFWCCSPGLPMWLFLWLRFSSQRTAADRVICFHAKLSVLFLLDNSWLRQEFCFLQSRIKHRPPQHWMFVLSPFLIHQIPPCVWDLPDTRNRALLTLHGARCTLSLVTPIPCGDNGKKQKPVGCESPSPSQTSGRIEIKQCLTLWWSIQTLAHTLDLLLLSSETNIFGISRKECSTAGIW